jgi:cytochrome c oxidase assembly protein subunit 15
MVTSNQAGLSVPDWPTSYGWNMFTFPPSKWVGGIFYEHGHRLVASFVGFLTVILASWAWLRESRLWLRLLSLGALVAVITQGILGGLTVKYLLPTSISMTHACLAQTFFCMTIALTFFTSPTWKHGLPRVRDRHNGLALPTVCALTTGAVYLQLLLGAWMRHTQSGLAIPDFPLAFGRIIPAFANYHVAIHFAHRVGAATVTVLIGATTGHVFFHHARRAELRRPALLILVLLVVQVTLGAITVLGNKPFIINSLHVVNGALVLVTSLVLTLRAHRSRFGDAGSAEQDPAYDGTDAARTLTPDYARRAKAGEVRDAAKGYGGVRA